MDRLHHRHNSVSGKVNNIAAFTLAEVLVAILILLMVSSIMAAGIPAAKRAYQGTVTASNAEVLLSTTISALQGKLGTASSAHADASTKSVIFYSADTHTESRIYYDPAGKNIMYQESYDSGTSANCSDPVSLVPRKAMDEDQLYPAYESVSVTGGVVTFKGLSIKKHKDDEVIASMQNVNNSDGDLSIRTLSGAKQ